MEKSMLKENTVHGSNIYPYAVYQWKGESASAVPLHWHGETEIIYLKAGTFSFSVNTKEYEQKAPALIFIGSEEIHSIQINMGDEVNSLVFDLKMLSFENYDGIQYKLLQPLIKGEMQFPMLILPEDDIWRETVSLCEEIFREALKKELGAYLKVKAELYKMLACFYQKDYLKNVKEIKEADIARLDTLKRILQYIRSHYDSRLPVEEIADVAGMNAQYFCRYFKKNTGRTVTEYINDIRINHAAKKLLESEDKIIDIAGQCGYDNVGYFIKRFRQCKGITPSDYRKENREKVNIV